MMFYKIQRNYSFIYNLLFSIFAQIDVKTLSFVRFMNISDRISALRKQKNMSQTDLGKVVGVSREIIGRYERGEVVPSVEVARKIAYAFDVSLDYLVGEGSNAHFDKETIKRLNDIEKLAPEDKSHVFALFDAFILKCSIQNKLVRAR